MRPGDTRRSACRFVSVLLYTTVTRVCAVSFEMLRRSAARSTISRAAISERHASAGFPGNYSVATEPNWLLGLRQVLQPLPGEHVRKHPAVDVSDDATPCVLKRIRL